MSTFEPASVLSILKNSSAVSTSKEKKEFESKWKISVSCSFFDLTGSNTGLTYVVMTGEHTSESLDQTP
jgi:hypothetical protein